MNEKLYLLPSVMIHEFFAKDVEEYDLLIALFFTFAVLPFPVPPRIFPIIRIEGDMYPINVKHINEKSGEHIVLDSHSALSSFTMVLNYISLYFSFFFFVNVFHFVIFYYKERKFKLDN